MDNNLTQREFEVLELIVEGKSNKQIAMNLNISVFTVKAYVKSICKKFDVCNRLQAAVFSLKMGYLQ